MFKQYEEPLVPFNVFWFYLHLNCQLRTILAVAVCFVRALRINWLGPIIWVVIETYVVVLAWFVIKVLKLVIQHCTSVVRHAGVWSCIESQVLLCLSNGVSSIVLELMKRS